ncbi:flavodoxin reductase [Candidatus Pacearchaeota archaeon]|nr:flavodoxin reductase [Candidatus Pacearchaeota archaeon]
MAQEHVVRIIQIEEVTHDVKRFIVEKPAGFQFIPGHSALVSINKSGLRDDKHPFTFTSTNDDPFLEFIIKRYGGMTKRLHELRPGDELSIADIFGSVRYQNKGVFIAAGTGITPFLAIFRQLNKDKSLAGNTLIYSNKMHKDIINEQELRSLFRDKLILTLTREEKQGYSYGRIDEAFLKKKVSNFTQHFYVCGPDDFSAAVKKFLAEQKAEADVLEF